MRIRVRTGPILSRLLNAHSALKSKDLDGIVNKVQVVVGQLFGPSTLSLGQPQTAAMPK